MNIKETANYWSWSACRSHDDTTVFFVGRDGFRDRGAL